MYPQLPFAVGLLYLRMSLVAQEVQRCKSGAVGKQTL
jgi:hypothetical protein